MKTRREFLKTAALALAGGIAGGGAANVLRNALGESPLASVFPTTPPQHFGCRCTVVEFWMYPKTDPDGELVIVLEREKPDDIPDATPVTMTLEHGAFPDADVAYDALVERITRWPVSPRLTS